MHLSTHRHYKSPPLNILLAAASAGRPRRCYQMRHCVDLVTLKSGDFALAQVKKTELEEVQGRVRSSSDEFFSDA